MKGVMSFADYDGTSYLTNKKTLNIWGEFVLEIICICT